MQLTRTLETILSTGAHGAPVVLVTGARQVGKSTLLHRASGGNRQVVTLDDPNLLQLARQNPAQFLREWQPPLTIDEFQYAPELLPHLKMAVDRDGTAGQYWLSGSQQFHLMRHVSESLAGRVAIFPLLGLSVRERLGQGQGATPFLPGRSVAPPPLGAPADATALYELIWRGSFPALCARPELDWDRFYASYVQTYLQRDLRDLARVGDEMAFLRFLRAVASRTAQLLNLANLARDADVAPNTAKAWLSILETSGLVTLLPPWHSSATSRLVKAPKLHMLDTGLCAWLGGWSSPQTLQQGALAGAILESWAVGEVLRSWWHAGRSVQLYHVRDKDGRELDLVVHRDGTLYPMEVKRSATPLVADLRGLAALAKGAQPLGHACLLCLVRAPLALGPEATAVPVGWV